MSKVTIKDKIIPCLYIVNLDLVNYKTLNFIKTFINKYTKKIKLQN